MLGPARRDPVPAATTFVGRVGELDLLEESLDAVGRGEPRAVEIVGPAGIGKTRLLAELSRRADARGWIVLAGTGAELEQDLPFWVFVDALDEYVESVEPRRLERLDDAVRSALGQVLPSLAASGAAVAQAVHERYRTHRAVRELLEQIAATKPLVLVLDDFHWADPASVDLLVALLHRPPAAGVLFALGARPQQLPDRLATALDRAHRDRTLHRIELGALSREEARALAGGDVDALYEESGGNPFYLEQLARAPATTGATAGPDVALAGVRVPPLVAAALAEELRLLSDPTRKVLDGASVAGDPFELDLAAVAADLPEPEVLDALDELVRLDLARSTDMPRRCSRSSTSSRPRRSASASRSPPGAPASSTCSGCTSRPTTACSARSRRSRTRSRPRRSRCSSSSRWTGSTGWTTRRCAAGRTARSPSPTASTTRSCLSLIHI